MPSSIERLRAVARAHPRWVDLAIAIATCATLIGTELVIRALSRALQMPSLPSTGLPVILGLAALSVPLALRRRFPASVLAVCMVAFVIGRLLGSQEGSITALALALAVFSAARYAEPSVARRVCGFFLVVLTVELCVEEFTGNDIPMSWEFVIFGLTTIAMNVALYLAMWGLGNALAVGAARRAELLEKTVQLENEQAARAQQAVFAERVRIARELHDVVAHHVSLMGVQAGAARLVMAADPERAASALSSIEEASRQAVSELHALLGFLRQEGDDEFSTPSPGLAQLDALAGSLRTSGLAVTIDVDGNPRGVGAAVDASAFRIVQEALTNTLKHAAATRADVHVAYRDDHVLIEIDDDGLGAAGPSARDGDPEAGARGGLGLVGMRERATLHGGHLVAGPADGGGFSVRATLPLPRVTA